MAVKPKTEQQVQAYISGEPKSLEVSVAQLLANVDSNIETETETAQQKETAMNTADNHSNPDPRKNFFRSSVASSNMSMRLESEAAMLRAEVDEVDRQIAELQARRTDLMLAHSMVQAGIDKGNVA